jgi:hypothetical protein
VALPVFGKSAETRPRRNMDRKRLRQHHQNL